MKALTIYEPYASLIAMGRKANETRPWSTHYRGPILIHAAAKPLEGKRENLVKELQKRGLLPTHWKPRYGEVVAIGEISEVRPAASMEPTELEMLVGEWKEGNYAFRLAGVRAVKPGIKAKGKQKIWDPPADLAHRAKANEC